MALLRRACAVALTVVLAGCGQAADEAERDEDRAPAEARAAIDALAAELGTDAEVTGDAIIDCVPGDDGSGQTLSYALSVTVGDDVLARLPQVAERYAADGWDAEVRGDGTRLAVRSEAASIVASVEPEQGRASVVGVGTCVL